MFTSPNLLEILMVGFGLICIFVFMAVCFHSLITHFFFVLHSNHLFSLPPNCNKLIVLKQFNINVDFEFLVKLSFRNQRHTGNVLMCHIFVALRIFTHTWARLTHIFFSLRFFLCSREFYSSRLSFVGVFFLSVCCILFLLVSLVYYFTLQMLSLSVVVCSSYHSISFVSFDLIWCCV